MNNRRISKLTMKFLSSTLFPTIIVLVIVSVVCYSVVSQNRMSTISQEIQGESAINNSKSQDMLERMLSISGFEEGYDVIYNYMVNYDSPQKLYFHTKAIKLLNSFATFEKGSVTSSWISIFDKGYIQSDEYNGFSDYTVESFSDYPWYDVNLLNTGDVYFSNGYVSNIYRVETNDRVISAVKPVFDKKTNVLIGAYGIDISMRYISSLYALGGYADSLMFILDKEGKLLYYSEGLTKERYAQAEDFVANNKLTEKESIKFKDKNYYINTFNATDKGWDIVFLTDSDYIQNSVNKITLPLLFVFVTAGIFLTIVMLVFIIRVVEKVKIITKSTRDIADGIYDNRMLVDSKDEFGELALAFNETIDFLKHMAEYDEITQVYNITTFYKVAEKLIKANDDTTGRYAIVRLDIDHFRIVNDLYNWQVGNNILLHIAKVIKEYLPKDSTFGRLSGDIFVLCVKYSDKEELEELLYKIKTEICKYDIMVDLNPHFGIYLEVEKDIPVYLMCDRAGIALSVIKGNLLNTISYYDVAIGKKNTNFKFIEANMHKAIEQNQFFIQLQPKVDMFTDTVVGAEALIRWEHPEKGLIRPDIFISIFEKNGFIIKLDEFVWEETCKQIRKWIDMGIKPVPISVNVSRIHIYDKYFVDKVTSLVKKYNIDTKYLELEFTESALLEEVDELYQLMKQLKEKGFVLLMDDFASGYSSLNTLKSAPFDIVKLDKDFISEISNSERDRQLVSSTISLINSQNMDIVVEGVEKKEQVDILKQSGCRIAQGYYYSRPINISDFEKLAFDI
ncbi:MAG: EAL domain-containing protein [Lachnospiraceae bacterium]|nr:EAL domain-containing protein [Lachnospiraceae bacterium]